jgi:hypothetical protein
VTMVLLLRHDRDGRGQHLMHGIRPRRRHRGPRSTHSERHGTACDPGGMLDRPEVIRRCSQIMHYDDAEFRREEATSAVSSHAKH